MKECPICNKKAEDDIKICPHCGHDFDFKYKRNEDEFKAQFVVYEDPVNDISVGNLQNKYKSASPEEKREEGTKSVLGVLFIFNFCSMFFGLMYMINVGVLGDNGNNYGVLGKRFIICFGLANIFALLVFCIPLLLFKDKKSIEELVSFGYFYLSLFWFAQVFVVFNEYTIPRLLAYIIAFVLGLFVTTAITLFIKKQDIKKDYIGLFFKVLGCIWMGATIIFALAKIVSKFNVDLTISYDTHVVIQIWICALFAFLLGVTFVIFIKNVIDGIKENLEKKKSST